jgi:hypothetical protein
MTSKHLSNLARTGSLKAEPSDQAEFDGLVRSARARMKDAQLAALSKDSKFDLAYAAAHSFSLAALRWHGFRSENRYLVFQCTPHTLGLDEVSWRTLADCHRKRNIAEYEGYLDISDELLGELIRIVVAMSDKIATLGPAGGG